MHVAHRIDTLAGGTWASSPTARRPAGRDLKNR
jgi:hypothetical protein